MNLHNRFIQTQLRESGILICTLSRPEVLNSLSTPLFLELKATLLAAMEDAETKLIILTGQGERAFVSGADLLELQDLSQPKAVQFSQLGHEICRILENGPKPSIAAIQGFALGGGVEMALSCDFIWASEKAVFGMPEVSLGLIPGFGGTLRLPKVVGIAKAKELIFSSKKIQAHEALAIGLIQQIFPARDFLEKVLEQAQKILSGSLPAIMSAKKLIQDSSEPFGLNAKIDAESSSFGKLFDFPDAKDRIHAFLNKNPSNSK